MDVIEKLRELSTKVNVSKYGEVSVGDENWRAIDDILDVYKPEGYEVDEVQTEFDEGGRWTNVETVVYKVTENSGAEAYFRVWREVPATEMQDGGDFTFGIREVEPLEVTVLQYVAKEAV
ncbi:hypothetical protein [Paenibacillus elgii]|uniref:hypothetical protein n=1 Tax=Paenibacillus elgii TaxID=189691 RepID=UPI000248C2E5|nr:hypothetical protein [Paenibacillus elgii]